MIARSRKPILQDAFMSRRRAMHLRWPMRLLLLLCLLTLSAGAVWLVVRPGLDARVDGIPPAVHRLLRRQHHPYVPIARISPLMQHAIVAVEDRRFYQHHGIDLHGMLRAAVNDIRARRFDEGGATLTAQLVERTVSLPTNPVLRVLDIVGLTWVAEDDFSKRQILDLYLNDVYYGRGAYGISAAAWRYFRVGPAHLNLRQAAFLASLPQAPSYYGQYPNSPIVQGRWRTVIQDMAQQGYITSAQEQHALRAGLTLRR